MPSVNSAGGANETGLNRGQTQKAEREAAQSSTTTPTADTTAEPQAPQPVQQSDAEGGTTTSHHQSDSDPGAGSQTTVAKPESSTADPDLARFPKYDVERDVGKVFAVEYARRAAIATQMRAAQFALAEQIGSDPFDRVAVSALSGGSMYQASATLAGADTADQSAE